MAYDLWISSSSMSLYDAIITGFEWISFTWVHTNIWHGKWWFCFGVFFRIRFNKWIAIFFLLFLETIIWTRLKYPLEYAKSAKFSDWFDYCVGAWIFDVTNAAGNYVPVDWFHLNNCYGRSNDYVFINFLFFLITYCLQHT